MNLDVHELTAIYTNFQGAATDSISLAGVMTDTRKELKQSIFVPLVGDSFNAHNFLSEAIKQGAVATLWEQKQELPGFVPTDFPVFFVDDTTEALQRLASYYLRKIDPVVVGVTGSNGKTTTKDMIASVLSTTYKTHKTAGNYNNHIGLPLTILSMDKETEALVLEMGMNHAGEISLLSQLAQPQYAVITNIGESHIENLGSREAIAAAKREILEGLSLDGLYIYDGDERLLTGMDDDKRSISCGFNDQSTYPIKINYLEDDQSIFSVKGDLYKLPMAGRHNVKNATYVIALAELLGIEKQQIQQGFQQLQMSTMRFERHLGKNQSLIINDAYNASPTSMKAVIEVTSQLKSKNKKVLVLGDMFELGEQSEQLHAVVAEAIDSTIDAVYTIGNHSAKISEAVSMSHPNVETCHFHDKKSLSNHILTMLTSDTVVLVKASRGMKLEEIVNDLIV